MLLTEEPQRSRTLGVLCALVATLTACSGRQLCDLRPPSLNLPGAHWDPGLERIELHEATEECRAQLNPQALESQLTEIELPAIDVAGYVSVNGGRVKLDKRYAVDYEKLSELSHLAVVNAVQQCADINRRYSCFVYDSVSDSPGQRFGKEMHDRIMQIASVKRQIAEELKKVDNAPPEKKEDVARQAQETIQSILNKVSTELPASPPPGITGTDGQPASPLGTTGTDGQPASPPGTSDTGGQPAPPQPPSGGRPPEGGISLLPLEARVSLLERQVIAVHEAFEEAHQELTKGVERNDTVSQKAIEVSVQALGLISQCADKVKRAKQAVLDERKRFLDALKLPSEHKDALLTQPLRASLGISGFAECDTTLTKGMTSQLDTLAAGISSFLASGSGIGAGQVDAQPLYLDIWGYSDEQPFLHGTNPKCDAFTSNLDLAKARAKSIQEYLKKKLPKEVRLDHQGNDSIFIKKCSQYPREHQDACHGQNRRFEAIVRGKSLIFEAPICP